MEWLKIHENIRIYIKMHVYEMFYWAAKLKKKNVFSRIYEQCVAAYERIKEFFYCTIFNVCICIYIYSLKKECA